MLERLVLWASKAVARSTNQPALPHVIFVANRVPQELEGSWDTELQTEK